jgi:hypothetical protein
MFCVVVYFVFRGSICKRAHVRIISIGQDPASLLLEGLWEEVLRPEVVFGSPCVMGVAVQAMHKHDAVERSARFLCLCIQGGYILD